MEKSTRMMLMDFVLRLERMKKDLGVYQDSNDGKIHKPVRDANFKLDQLALDAGIDVLKAMIEIDDRVLPLLDRMARA